jgi:outer membrane murein-binding lipoprotein Lpp
MRKNWKMKITKLSISHYLGIKSLDQELSRKVFMVAGHNGKGKSSIGEAIRHALQGEFDRVDYKKDLGQLIHPQSDAGGSVFVNTTLGEFAVTLPAGDVIGDHSALNPLLGYCLQPARFASASSDDRRKLLFRLMKVSATPDGIAARLKERGALERYINEIRPYLAGGFDAANKEASNFARDAKASWRTVTGETYGEKKAEGWALPLADASPHVDPNEVKELETKIADLNIKVGGLRAQRQAAQDAIANAEGKASRKAELTAQASQYAQIQDDLNKATDEHGKLSRKIHEYQEVVASPEHTALTCPHCAGLSILEDGQLEPYEGETSGFDRAAVKDLLDDAIAEFSKQGANIQALTKSLAEADGAAKALDLLDSQPDPAGDSLETLDQKIKSTMGEIYDDQNRLNILRNEQKNESEHNAKEAAIRQKNADATLYHTQVKHWDLIAKALAPEGIPSELLAEAIEPFNASLKAAGNGLGRFEISVTPDLDIYVGSVPYALRSESEKWRADAIISAAIAKLSGVGIILLDRFDVLDLPGRNELIGWLSAVDLDQAIIMGTMKAAPPATLPDFIETLWLE